MNAYKTAISRSKPSSPMRNLALAGKLYGRMLDYGCGKGFDADYYNMTKYDTHYQPTFPEGEFDVITCNYVLNVIQGLMERMEVIANIYRLLAPTGKAYITVRRDVEGEVITKKGTFQKDIYLNLPILWENSNFCTYVLTK
jgi:ubiquinone/menaquinone biosynthesis C-methylase UbiE